MNEITLSALKGDSPIGAMAAFGLLGICSHFSQLGHVGLRWKRQAGTWTGVLSTTTPVSKDELVRVLVEYMASVPQRMEFTWSEQIKSVSASDYRKHAALALDEASARDHLSADWFTAFGSDLITEDGVVVSTPFDMTVARQKFLADMRKLAMALATDKAGVAAFNEALFGPWLYNDDQHSLGWDPSAMRLGAFTSDAPTKMANSGVRAAVWLAFESMPLFPCFAANGRLSTRGIRRRGRQDVLIWPVWSSPLSLECVRTLIGLEELCNSPDLAFPRGIEAVYESVQFKPNKYMISFQPAVLAAGAN